MHKHPALGPRLQVGKAGPGSSSGFPGLIPVMTPGPIWRDHGALRYPANPSHGGLQYRLGRAEAAGTGGDCSDSQVKGQSTESTNTPPSTPNLLAFLSFSFAFWATLCSGITPGSESRVQITPSRIWGTTWDVGDRTWIHQVKA